jgi:hypothetical protein
MAREFHDGLIIGPWWAEFQPMMEKSLSET